MCPPYARRYPQAGHEAFRLIEARAGLRERDIPVYPGAVYQRFSYSRGFIPGRTAQEIEPGGRAAAEIDELFRWTANLMGLALPQTAIEAARPVRRGGLFPFAKP